MLPLAIDDLERSGIALADAERAGMFAVDSAATIYPDFRPEPALVIPYYEVDGQTPMTFDRDGQQWPFCRIRYLAPHAPPGGFTGPQKAQRYAQPAHSGVRVYFCPLREWSSLVDNPSEPIVITEGEKKAAAGILAGLPVIGLGGVWNYGTGLVELLPELEAFKWQGRDVYIVFDSDAAKNPGIMAAEARLVYELGTKRGARCFIVHLPPGADEAAKVGLDDFLISRGVNELTTLLQQTPSLGALDAKVLQLNNECAWVESEGLIYDLQREGWIRKDHFTSGSRFSAIKHVTMGGKKRTTPHAVSVATVWLSHPHAQRFSDVIFRPGMTRVIQNPGRQPSFNLWNGWNEIRGVSTDDPRIAAFLALNDYLFKNVPAEHRDLALKLVAYKAQNPMSKVPIALVLIGDQGCGKSLWGECIGAAFAPYFAPLKSKAFGAEFQNWLEKSVFIAVDEVERKHLDEYGDQLKNLISGRQIRMNDKFRPERLVESYAMYLLTANDRAVGSYSADDRRMFVVDCPKKMTDRSLYLYLGAEAGSWQKEDGHKALMGWLLDYPLNGWVPPAEPPLTAEKYLAYTEGLTPIQALAEQMKIATSSRVVEWIAQARAWASEAEVGNDQFAAGQARAIAQAADRFPIRDWYTPEELALLFPNVMALSLHTKYRQSTAPGQLSRELRNAGVPYLVNRNDPRGFRLNGLIKQFLVVANFDDWRLPITQEDFDRAIQNAPAFGAVYARRPR